MSARHAAFTLIELLVVIAIIAILAVVVVLVLNPAELLKQSRDANRLSDLATLQSAIGLYQVDVGGSIGTSSQIYVSLPDASSTCASQGFSSGYSCVSATSSRNVDGTGWIPINFKNISAGVPFGSLPVDPTNASSSNLFYMYAPNGSQYQLFAFMESQKYQTNGSNLGGLVEAGNGAAGGLIGWWKFDEGTGSTAGDSSGAKENGAITGTATGTSGYFTSPGIQGPWKIALDGATTKVVATVSYASLNTFTINGWVNALSWGSYGSGYINLYLFGGTTIVADNGGTFRMVSGNYAAGGGSTFGVSNMTWIGATHMVTWEVDPATVSVFIDGVFQASSTRTTSTPVTNPVLQLGNTFPGRDLVGYQDDIRIYNRLLSTADLAALYVAKK